MMLVTFGSCSCISNRVNGAIIRDCVDLMDEPAKERTTSTTIHLPKIFRKKEESPSKPNKKRYDEGIRFLYATLRQNTTLTLFLSDDGLWK